MKFLNEPWFWAGFFTAMGSLGTVLIKELLFNRNQIGLERLRLHERECLDAYKKLYSFVLHAIDMLFPPEEPRKEFISIMKGRYATEAKPNMLLFNSTIRDLLRELETQYDCLSNPDLIPSMTFDDFIDKRAGKLFDTLLLLIEKETDLILH